MSKSFLYYCPSCKRKHRLKQQPCPECGVYYTAQPVSDNVANKCHEDYACDGCVAYRDHLR